MDRLNFNNFDRIWTPDLIHVNSQSNSGLKKDAFVKRLVLFLSDGMAVMMLYGSIQSYCDLDFTDFPFDRQKCYFQFNFGLAVDDINLHVGNVITRKNAFPDNSNWFPLGLYKSGFLGGDNVTQTIVFECQRDPTYFVINLLLPGVILSLLELATFMIPPDCGGDRSSFAATILLSMFLLQSETLTFIPKTPKKVNVSIYILLVIIQATLVTMYAAFSTWFVHRFPKNAKKKTQFFKLNEPTFINSLDIIASISAIIFFLSINIVLFVSFLI